MMYYWYGGARTGSVRICYRIRDALPSALLTRRRIQGLQICLPRYHKSPRGFTSTSKRAKTTRSRFWGVKQCFNSPTSRLSLSLDRPRRFGKTQINNHGFHGEFNPWGIIYHILPKLFAINSNLELGSVRLT